MNSKQIKDCFDAMSPTAEQKAKMLSGVLDSEQTTKKYFLPRYAAVLAAVLMIVVGAAVYSVPHRYGNLYEESDETKTDVVLQNSIVEEEEVESKTATDGSADMVDKYAYTEDMVATGSGIVQFSSAVARKELSLDDIQKDEIYGQLFPKAFVQGYAFSNAVIDGDVLDVTLVNKKEEYMSVIVAKEGYEFTEKVVEAENINTASQEDGYMRFAVQCGEYYVIYNVKTKDGAEVYKMVTSSPYFEKKKG